MTLNLVVAGTIDSFDEFAFQSGIASYLQVNAADVVLTISAGSLRVQARVTFASEASAHTAASRMTESKSIESLSVATGALILSQQPPAVSSSSTAAWAPQSPTPTSTPPPATLAHLNAGQVGNSGDSSGIVVGITVAAVMIVCAIGLSWLWCQLRKRRTKRKEVEAASIDFKVDPGVDVASCVTKASAQLHESTQVAVEAQSPAPAMSPTSICLEIRDHLHQSELARRSSISVADEVSEERRSGQKDGGGWEQGDSDDDDSGRVESVAKELSSLRLDQRLQQRLAEQRRVDLLLEQQQLGDSSLRHLRFYEPSKAAADKLIQAQAVAITLHARQRTRERFASAAEPQTSQTRRSITRRRHHEAAISEHPSTPERPPIDNVHAAVSTESSTPKERRKPRSLAEIRSLSAGTLSAGALSASPRPNETPLELDPVTDSLLRASVVNVTSSPASPRERASTTVSPRSPEERISRIRAEGKLRLAGAAHGETSASRQSHSHGCLPSVTQTQQDIGTDVRWV